VWRSEKRGLNDYRGQARKRVWPGLKERENEEGGGRKYA
jgi:hypothetical protein